VNWRLDTKTTNQTLFDQVYQVLINGQVVTTSQVIRPGDSFEFHYSDPQKKSIQLVRYTVTPEGQRTNAEYSRTIGTNDGMWYQDGSTSPGFNNGTDNPVGVPTANVGRVKSHTPTQPIQPKKTRYGKSATPFMTLRRKPAETRWVSCAGFKESSVPSRTKSTPASSTSTAI